MDNLTRIETVTFNVWKIQRLLRKSIHVVRTTVRRRGTNYLPLRGSKIVVQSMIFPRDHQADCSRESTPQWLV